jgi:single-strand DNA-binding protein
MSATLHVTGTVASVEDMKYFDSGKTVLKFSLVTPNGEPKKDGDDYAPSQFYKVELWDKQAKAMEPHVVKGAKFYVVGKHVVRHWETDTAKGIEEQIKYPTTVEPFVWQKSEDDSEQRTTTTTKRPSQPALSTPVDDDSVPF